MRLHWRDVATGMGFTEGPVDTAEGIVFTSINRGKLFIARHDGELNDYAETGGGPNGLAVAGSGEIFVAQNGGHVVPTRSALPASPSIQAVSADGAVRVVSDGYFAPNDAAFGPDGRLYFSDPNGSTKVDKPAPGRVWALDVLSGERELLADDMMHPNGIAFTPDGETLLVTETLRHRILRFSKGPGGWRRGGVFAALPVGEPDGLAFDEQGRLWCAASAGDAIIVFAPDGKPLHILELGPSFPTNLCFGGPDRAMLYVTAPKGGRLMAAEVDVPGIALF